MKNKTNIKNNGARNRAALKNDKLSGCFLDSGNTRVSVSS
jgi:hypothetical protein